MDFVAALFFVLITVLVVVWTVSLLAKKHVYVMTTLSPDRAAAACDQKFSGLAWRRVEGRGDLNYQARGFAIGGATPPVMSISIETDDASGLTAVEFWMSKWTTRYGMVNHVEKVFWKRWSIPKALREAETAAPIGTRMSSQPGATGPVTSVHFAGSAPAPPISDRRKAASDDPEVMLPDPGRPENDLKQLGYRLLQACGLSYLTWGPVPLEQHQHALLRQIPALRDASVNPAGVGTQGNPDNPDGMWMAYEGALGSVLAFHVLQSTDDTLDVGMRLPLIDDPINWGIATLGASVPAGVAEILASARAVPLWELSAFTGPRSTDENPYLPSDLASGLLARGWTQVDDGDGFRLDVALSRGGSQAVFFTPYDAESFAIVVPVRDSNNGAIPDSLRGRVFRHYGLEVIAGTVVLCERFPAGPSVPDPDTITAAGRTATLYAEEQFSDPATASATSNTVPPYNHSFPPPVGAVGSAGGAIGRPGITGAYSRPSSRPSRGWIYAAAAGLVAVVLAFVLVGVVSGREHDATATDTAGIPGSRASGDIAGQDRDGSDGRSPVSPQVSPNSLNVTVPMSHPACDGSGIVVLANAVTPGRYDAEIQHHLDMHPGASYLRTDESCPSLRPRDDAGNPIYAVYRLAGSSRSEVCAAVRAASGDAYGKWLDTTTNPRDMITC